MKRRVIVFFLLAVLLAFINILIANSFKLPKKKVPVEVRKERITLTGQPQSSPDKYKPPGPLLENIDTEELGAWFWESINIVIFPFAFGGFLFWAIRRYINFILFFLVLGVSFTAILYFSGIIMPILSWTKLVSIFQFFKEVFIFCGPIRSIAFVAGAIAGGSRPKKTVSAYELFNGT